MKFTIYAPKDEIVGGAIVIKEYLKKDETKTGRYYSSWYGQEGADGKFIHRWSVWRTKSGVTAKFLGDGN